MVEFSDAFPANTQEMEGEVDGGKTRQKQEQQLDECEARKIQRQSMDTFLRLERLSIYP